MYLHVFGHYKKSKESLIAANTFRLTQALVMSVPLLILNMVTLISSLKTTDLRGQNALDLVLLKDHINEGMNKPTTYL